MSLFLRIGLFVVEVKGDVKWALNENDLGVLEEMMCI
jgi:hypothetical protein